MRVGVVLASVVVPVSVDRFVRGDPLQPFLVVVMQTAFVVIDEHGGGDVHGVDQTKPFLNSTFMQRFLHLAGDVDKSAAGWDVEPEFFAIGFHG